jgi:hypothetical protein
VSALILLAVWGDPRERPALDLEATLRSSDDIGALAAKP